MVSGRNSSSSRIRLRATTASAVSRPPSRATTRIPISLLPGVAARCPISKPMNQKLRSRKPPSIQMLSMTPERDAKPSHSISRSEEHTSELQSLMRISYAVFCLKKKKTEDQDVNQKNQNKKKQQ